MNMFIQTVYDLWTMKPAAYALVDEEGNLYEPGSPNEFYQYVVEAENRTLVPLLCSPPKSLDGKWGEFRKSLLPETVIYRVTNDGVVDLDDKKIWTLKKEDSGLIPLCLLGINSEIQRKDALKQGIRYGSGLGIGTPLEISSIF